MQNKAKKKPASLRLKKEVHHEEYDEPSKRLIKSVVGGIEVRVCSKSGLIWN